MVALVGFDNGEMGFNVGLMGFQWDLVVIQQSFKNQGIYRFKAIYIYIYTKNTGNTKDVLDGHWFKNTR